MLTNEVAHLSDSADKIVWMKFGSELKEKCGSVISTRVGIEIFCSFAKKMIL